MIPLFQRYVGIDYSGAETPKASLKGLRVYAADHSNVAREVAPPPSPRKYWSRKEIAEWLVFELRSGAPTLVGIDHAFSFPLQYFERYGLPGDWEIFLEDFRRHWPTDQDNTYVDFVRDGVCGDGQARCGNSRWRRLTEYRTRTAKSAFHFDVPGAVAKSTHAGLPWLLYLRHNLGKAVHFWPFDGWDLPLNCSLIVEVYPSMWNRMFATDGRTADQQDAYVIAESLRQADANESLAALFHPRLDPADVRRAHIEGWIFGVP